MVPMVNKTHGAHMTTTQDKVQMVIDAAQSKHYAQVPVEFEIALNGFSTGAKLGCIMCFAEDGNLVGVMVAVHKGRHAIEHINAMKGGDPWSHAIVHEAIRLMNYPDIRKTVDTQIGKFFNKVARTDPPSDGKVVALDAKRNRSKG
jgi:hypothetical protein